MTEPAAPPPPPPAPPAPVPLSRRAIEGSLIAGPTAGVLALGAVTGEPWLREAIQGLLQQGPTVALAVLVLGVLWSHYRELQAEHKTLIDDLIRQQREDELQARRALERSRDPEGRTP